MKRVKRREKLAFFPSFVSKAQAKTGNDEIKLIAN